MTGEATRRLLNDGLMQEIVDEVTNSQDYYLVGESAVFFAYKSRKVPKGVSLISTIDVGKEYKCWEKNRIERVLDRVIKCRYGKNFTYRMYTRSDILDRYQVFTLDGTFMFTIRVDYIIPTKVKYDYLDCKNSYKTLRTDVLFKKTYESVKDCLKFSNLYDMCFLAVRFADEISPRLLRKAKRLFKKIDDSELNDVIYLEEYDDELRKELLGLLETFIG